MMYRFGDHELDCDRVELRIDGQTLAIQPQVFDVLEYLVVHRDRVVSKEELLDNVWGDRFVSESALTSRIKSARQALGDSGREQAIIKTVHGRGYRFVAAVDELEVAAVSEAPAPVAVRKAPPPARASPDTDTDELEQTQSGLDDRWPLIGRHNELAELADLFHDPGSSGILFTGPAGIGKTRLGRECLELAARQNLPTLRISGHAEAGAVPLASMAHVLPADVVEHSTTQGDLARAVVFQRARAALDEWSKAGRVVLMVDDVDQIDDLSAALIGTWIATGNVFVVLTQRTTADSVIALEELVRSGSISRIDLDPLDETDLDVLLYRVLAGPIETTSLDQLARLSAGSPGVLQQLVESSIANRALERQADVWRLVAPLTPSVGLPGSDHHDLDLLETDARRGADLLALAGDLDLDVATELVGASALDALDSGRLLELTETGTGTRVAIAHPHVALLLADGLGQLRARRYRSDLIDAVTAMDDPTETDTVHLVRWQIENGVIVDPGAALDAARRAVSASDEDSADLIIEALALGGDTPELTNVRAELAFRRGQMNRAEHLLGSIDVDTVDPGLAATVARRQATIGFHIRGDFDPALDRLAAAAQDFDGDERQLLEAHWLGLQAFYGRANVVLERGGELLTSIRGAPRLEVLRALAMAHVAAGSPTAALDAVEQHARLSAHLPPAAARPGNETAAAAAITAHILLGSLHRAIDLVRLHLPVGKRTLLGWLPISGARAELAAGRPRAARELLTTPLAAVRSQGLLHAVPIMTAIHAQASVHLGDLERAHRDAVVAEESLPRLGGVLRSGLIASLAEVWAALGDIDKARDALLQEADLAGESAAWAFEADLLARAAGFGAAAEVTERIDVLVENVEGVYWPVRARQVRALAEGTPLDEVAEQFERLGYLRLAAACR